MNTKKLLVISTLLVILIWGFIIYRNMTNNSPLPIGGTTDEYGCLSAGGYTWCQTENKCLRIFEEFCPDAVLELANNIQAESGVLLLDSGRSTFNWLTWDGSINSDTKITGVLYSAESVKLADYNKIEKYMNDNLESDKYNMADGVQGGLRGYYGNYMVCTLNFEHAKMAENKEGLLEPVGDSLKVTLECGYYNKNNVENIIVE